jgi:hypothetical protein
VVSERRDAAVRNRWPEIAIRQESSSGIHSDDRNGHRMGQKLSHRQTALVAGGDDDDSAARLGVVQHDSKLVIVLRIVAQDRETQIDEFGARRDRNSDRTGQFADTRRRCNCVDE